MECVVYCGKQGISFKGHIDDATDTDSANRGNFISLVKFRAQTDETS